MRKKIRTNTAVLLLCVLLCGCTRREQLILETAASEQEQQVPEGAEQTDSAQSRENAVIYVHVCGAVEKPDVYELPAGSRVYEAVKAAGGFSEDADNNYVNQAQTLSDGVKLVIPTREQTEAVVSEGADNSVSDGKININTASEAELCNIPGIGAVRAAAIIAYRQEKGGFSSIEDIMNVSGIKEGTYEKIKDSIKIN